MQAGSPVPPELNNSGTTTPASGRSPLSIPELANSGTTTPAPPRPSPKAGGSRGLRALCPLHSFANARCSANREPGASGVEQLRNQRPGARKEPPAYPGVGQLRNKHLSPDGTDPQSGRQRGLGGFWPLDSFTDARCCARREPVGSGVEQLRNQHPGTRKEPRIYSGVGQLRNKHLSPDGTDPKAGDSGDLGALCPLDRFAHGRCCTGGESGDSGVEQLRNHAPGARKEPCVHSGVGQLRNQQAAGLYRDAGPSGVGQLGD